jgi:hypothetical protein|nr:MAG TPA: hypothetical protein [Crassvirales sp.]
MGYLRIRYTNKQDSSFLILKLSKMSKTKRIKVLEEFIRLEKLEKNSRQDYIVVCEEAANKLKNELKTEEKRVSRYLILISQNTNKRKESYSNRKLIKAGERESYRQRKIRLNKERRESLHNG